MNNETTTSISELANRFTQLMAEAQRLNYLVRDIDLQRGKISELHEFVVLVKRIKEPIVQSGHESLANPLFLFQCMSNAHRSVLNMWIELKENKPARAWECLVDAQEYTSIALRIPVTGKVWGITECAQRLADIERIIFPGWPRYLSPGIVERDAGTCSICGIAYSDCQEHLEGLVYCGRLCERVERTPIEINHTAMVEFPHDKRCIVTHIEAEGGRKQDYITLRILDEKFNKNGNEEGLMMDCIVFSTKRLDVD